MKEFLCPRKKAKSLTQTKTQQPHPERIMYPKVLLLVLALVWPVFVFGGQEEVVRVQFYGEAQCPFCRKFVREAWPTVWHDAELMQHVDYDFVAWGNAYFQIDKCSNGDVYDADERACWYENCSPNGNRIQKEEDYCFSGNVIYQHSDKEGQVSHRYSMLKILVFHHFDSTFHYAFIICRLIYTKIACGIIMESKPPLILPIARREMPWTRPTQHAIY